MLDETADREKKQASATDTKLKGAALGAIVATAAAAARTLGNVFENIEKINTADLSKIDSQLAGQIDQMKTLANAASDPIGALVALANGGTTVDQAFAEMNDEIRRNAEQRERDVERVLQRGIIQVEEIKKLSADLRAANALLDAKDSADSAARDRADARKIREGADPDDVRSKRAEDDAATAYEGIARDVAEKSGPLKELGSNADTARATADGLQAKAAVAQQKLAVLEKERDALRDELEDTSMFNLVALKNIRERVIQNANDRHGIEKSMPEADVIKRAEAAATETKKAYDDQKKIAHNAELQAEQKRREIRERSQAIVEDAAGDKAAKKKQETEREQQKKDQETEREQQKKDQEKEREDAKREREKAAADRDREKSTSGVAREAQDAVKRLPSGLKESFRKDFEKVAAGLQDGDQAHEVKDLLKMMKQLADFSERKGTKTDTDISGLRAQIVKLEGQLKNNRRG